MLGQATAIDPVHHELAAAPPLERSDTQVGNRRRRTDDPAKSCRPINPSSAPRTHTLGNPRGDNRESVAPAMLAATGSRDIEWHHIRPPWQIRGAAEASRYRRRWWHRVLADEVARAFPPTGEGALGGRANATSTDRIVRCRCGE